MAIGNEIRILLVGKSGSGKSSSGNTIFYEAGKLNVFLVAAQAGSTTPNNDKVTKKGLRNRTITVVDTPGTQNTDIKEYDIAKEIYGAVERSKEGYDAILIVLRYKRDGLDDEEMKSILLLQKTFSEEFFGHVIFLFTQGDAFENVQEDKRRINLQPLPFEDEIMQDVYSTQKHYAVGPIIEKAKGGVMLFNNIETDDDKKIQMSEKLLKKIEEFKKVKDYKRYTKKDLPPPPSYSPGWHILYGMWLG